MNPHSVSSYKTYTVTFRAIADEACTIVVYGVEALCAESAEKQALQVVKHPAAFYLIAVDEA